MTNIFSQLLRPNEKLDEEMALWLAVYYLDRANKTDYVTDEGSELILSAINRVERTCGYKSSKILNQLVEEFLKFSRQEGSFSERLNDGEDSKSWWQRQQDSALKPIASRLMDLKSSSADIERAFSTLNYIQGSNRLNFSHRTLINIAKIKVADFLDASEMIEDHDTAVEENLSRPRTGVLQTLGRIVSRRRTTRVSMGSLTQEFRHKPNLFKHVKLRKSYNKFMKIIDFNIINELQEKPQNVTLEEPEDVILNKATQRLRELRAQR